MNKRVLKLSALAIVSALALAACGGDTGWALPFTCTLYGLI